MRYSIDNIRKITPVEYILMFLVICISGNPVFIYTESKFIYAFFAILMFSLCLIKGKKLFSPKFIFWLICSFILFMLQNVILEYTSIYAEINFITRLYIAFLTASYFGNRFREIYFKVMIFVCTISIPMYILYAYGGINIGFDFDRYRTIIIYNNIHQTIYDTSYRNSGMFWEPGAFQGFIMLVPLLYSNNLKQLWNNNKKGCISLLLALLTTRSTTGYITFTLFIFLTIISNRGIKSIYKVLLMFVTIIFFVYVWQQDFMKEKLIEQYEEAKGIQQGDVSWNRMAGMVIDINNIKRHPIIGNGFLNKSRYGILGEYMKGTGNGFSGAINIFGIPFMILYFIGVFNNLRYLYVANRFIFIFTIILLLNGEYFLNYSMFWSLIFIKKPIDEYV